MKKHAAEIAYFTEALDRGQFITAPLIVDTVAGSCFTILLSKAELLEITEQLFRVYDFRFNKALRFRFTRAYDRPLIRA